MVKNTRIKTSTIVESQLPQFVRDDFPLVSQFLQQYYRSQEFQGGTLDILNNIDQYVKVDELTDLKETTSLSQDITIFSETIPVESTKGFPETYGLIQIDSEVITYTGITTNTFTGCVRGFSGITSYRSKNKPDELIFSETESQEHKSGATVRNLNVLFLKEFFVKTKKQILPGFESREFYSGVNQKLFTKQAKDFYKSKGTDESFKILFKALYGKKVDVIKPRDFLIEPSDAQYRVTKDLVVEAISGDPLKLKNRTLFQNQTSFLNAASGSVTNVEKVVRNAKTYYLLSLDYDFDKDINVSGSVYGNFSIHPKTKLIGNVSAGSTVLDVDSTIGFPTSGEIVTTDANGLVGIISYRSKTINQFFGCTSSNGSTTPKLNSKAELRLNAYAFGYTGIGTTGGEARVRISGVLSDLNILGDNYGYADQDEIKIKSLGSELTDVKSTGWKYNVATKYQVTSITLVDVSDYTYRLRTREENSLNLGDNLKLVDSTSLEKNTTVISIENATTFLIKGQGPLDLSRTFAVERILSKVDAINYPSSNVYTSNVQNVYADLKNSIYVASPSLPSYFETKLNIKDRSISISGSQNSEITTNGNHGFLTGDAVYYSPVSSNDSLGISTGVYYVKKISDSKVKIYRSKANIFNDVAVAIGTTTVTSANKFVLFDFSNQTLEPQKLLRKISNPENDGETHLTVPGSTGILMNGVEILNYKSKDSVFYGPIEEIIVSAGGTDYDVINPPTFAISDSVGSGATAFCEIEGSLQRIDLIDGGFDYITTPIVNINGGNGKGAVAKVETVTVEHESKFNASSTSLLVDLTNNTIAFSSYHKFRDGEEIVYKTDGQKSLSGISTDSRYNLSIQDAFTVKVHRTFEDAIAGINTINLTSFGEGVHRFVSTSRKKIISGVKLVSGGSGYRNRKIVVSSDNVSTAKDTIYAKNHRYNSGEIITYSTTGSAIGGLTNSQTYYVIKVDDDNFKLSLVGSGTTNSDFYYNTNQYVNLTSVGSGNHTFNYPPITVEVSGVIGVSTISGQNFGAVVQPIFRGEIKSTFLQSGGQKYGSEEIINYNRQPLFTLNSGSGAEVLPVVFGGRIVEVVVKNSGSGYNSPPTLKVSGDGSGAELTPVISNGILTAVKVVNGGLGYSQKNTVITVISSGSQAKFQAQIRPWNINLFERLIQTNLISADDGVIDKGFNDNYGLQYTHLYSPRKLRQSIFSKRTVDGNTVYDPDLIIDKTTGKEINSTSHSPIIGWAYDGNPIYGPYGYSSPTGGSVRAMVSGYKSRSPESRPNLGLYPQGIFVDDYEFDNTGDLDEYNGRFCITPEFPNGVYAYFTTINSGLPEDDGPFKNYKKPQFPYFIANEFKSKPIEFNYGKGSNQDEYDINNSGWSRNVTPYNLNSDSSDYDYLLDPNKIIEQNSEIKSIYAGRVERINVIDGGSNYKVKDPVIFDNTNTEGGGVSAEVSYVKGKVINSISVASTSVTSIEFAQSDQSGVFIGLATAPHNLLNGDEVTVSGLSTTGTNFQRFFKIKVPTNQLVLRSSTGSTAITGIVTFFDVSGNINYPNIRENDVFTIENEKVKVLSIDFISNRIKVQRSYGGTVGASHTASTSLVEDPSKFLVDVGFVNEFNFRENRQFYFNPSESVGLGTVSGIGVTVSVTNPGAGLTQVVIPTKAIYIPNHNLETGTELVYSTNGGSPITVSTGATFTLTEGQIVYAAKVSKDFIGIATNKIGLGSTGEFIGIGETNVNGTLYFTQVGSGDNHSFKTRYNNTLSGRVDKNVVTVATAATHGLKTNDFVRMDIQPGISTSLKVIYNRINRRVIVNPFNFLQSNIDANNNIITKENHGLYTGQKLIFESTIRQEDSTIVSTVTVTEDTIYPSPMIIESSGTLIIQSPATVTVDTDILENNGIYYAVALDYNRFKLADSFYNATLQNPITVRITGNSYGRIGPVNPPVALIKNQTLEFDLSDASLSYLRGSQRYSAYELNFYSDSNFKNIFDSSSKDSIFEVSRSGSVGVDTNAKVSIKSNNKIPQTLYYKLDSVDLQNVPSSYKEVIVDKENIINANSLLVIDSGYSGSYRISGTSTTSFNYNLLVRPEKSGYISSDGSLLYTTNSRTVIGEISQIEIKSEGRKYKKLPQVLEVSSSTGSGAILEPFSSGIGSIKTIRIKDIGFDYPSDKTLRPTAKIPEVLKLDPLASFERIGISSAGIGYALAPNLVVIDGFTNKVVNDVSLKYKLGDPTVTILKNTTTLYNTTPRIVPINNSNGVGIKSMFYNSTTKDVTVVLNVGYSTASSFPFNVGDKILIENVSIGINSTSKGYNSENYDYKLFSVKSTDPNIGGVNGSVVYNLSDYLASGETPGSFDPINSSGVIVPEKYFPIFTPTLKKDEFIIGETVRSTKTNTLTGKVVSTDSKGDYLKVSTSTGFKENEIIRGETSNSFASVKSIKSVSSIYNVDSSSIVKKGWNQETGFLNNDQQRMHDNEYYQYFSYSLKSEVPYDTWNNPVSNLDHTAGFKKFSDLVIETRDENSVGIGTTQDGGDVTGIADLSSLIDLQCYTDFDLATENNLFIGNKVYSDEIIFKSKEIQDYLESIGNRVLVVDDFSDQFNNLPRGTKYTVVDTFKLNAYRARKYVIFIRDRRFTEDRETIIATLLHDNSYGYINQYGRVESVADMGFFDFEIEESTGKLLFYPNKFRVNDFDISFVSYSIKDSIAGIGSTSLGDIVDIKTSNTNVSLGTTTSIVGIASTYRSAKILVELQTNDGRYEFDELTLIHDGSEAELIEYGQLTNHSLDAASSFGLGSYSTRFSGSNLIVDFTPITGVAATVNTLCVSIASTLSTGVGTSRLNTTQLNSSFVSIASSTSPVQNKIAQYSNTYSGGYYLVSIEDKTNGAYQVSELMVVNNSTEVFITEFGTLETSHTLGDFEAAVSGSNVEIYFTPNPSADYEIRVFQNVLRTSDPLNPINLIDLNNGAINSGSAVYFGTEKDVKRSFDLKHKQRTIFKREFDGSSVGIVSITGNTIRVPENFFVTGEEVTYSHTDNFIQSSPIGIATTTISGIGLTDKLPSTLYIVKVDDVNVRVATSVTDALKTVPTVLTLTSVGIGTLHSFTSKKQNSRMLISIDNVIQSPVVSTAITTTLASQILTIDDRVTFAGITSFFSGDLVKVNDEIMRVSTVGVGTTNSLIVERAWMGTGLSTHSSGSLVTKLNGNYNIVGNTINFVDAPYGNYPIGTVTNPPNERDYTGVTTHSTFSGRAFMRSSEPNTSIEPYSYNYIFDDISTEFNGITTSFRLKSGKQDIANIQNSNAIVLINNVFQGPKRGGVVSISGDYELKEGSGITTAIFSGVDYGVKYDNNTNRIPRGGIIVSVGSSRGFGYQPLVSAGGTAIISPSGTITSVSIGNSGSGYRPGVQPTVYVRAYTSSGIGTTIGTATISNGRISTVTITNAGSGYTSTNPPTIVFDSPLSYSNIPLIYSSASSGVGTGAVVDVIVGQGSSVVDFEIKNYGFNYKQDQILTIPTSGNLGIPLDTTKPFVEFQISVDKTYNDNFSGWSIGDLQVFDPLDSLFDGSRTSFPLSIDGQQIAIKAKPGSKVDVEATLLVFINDILQVPGKGYRFEGGSRIVFTEPPKGPASGYPGPGYSSKILFYKGNSNVDVVTVDILETIKIGDEVTLKDDNFAFNQDERLVTEILATDTLATNAYPGPGISVNSSYERPLTWCKQTEDKFINGREVAKDRIEYESLINPTTNIIQSVGIASTVVYVESVKTFFDNQKENASIKQKYEIEIFSQDGDTVTREKIDSVSYVGDFGTVVGVATTTVVGLATTGVYGLVFNFDIPTNSFLRDANIVGSAITITGISTGDYFALSNSNLGYGITSLRSDGSVIGIGSTFLDNVYQVTNVDYNPKGTVILDDLTITGFEIFDSPTVVEGESSKIITSDTSVIVDTTFDSPTIVESGYTLTVESPVTLTISDIIKIVLTIADTGTLIIGDTVRSKVTVRVAGFNGLENNIPMKNQKGPGYYYGDFSWGKVSIPIRTKPKSFTSYSTNGYSGVSTSPILRRVNPLKYLNYI